MTNNYEATLALDTKGNEESVDEMLRTIEETFRKNNAKVTEIRKMERRTLAYETQRKGIREAFFVGVTFSADSAAIKPLRSALKLDDNILLTYVGKLEGAAA